ncbi:MAG TPA: hypothetical protein VGQ81_01530, partial [Acidobacteriota bacterium]|nr:hypothetical protein [Acidobacteriota bacterium]
FAVVGWRSLLRWKRQLAWPGMVVILFFPPIVYSCAPALLFNRSLQRYSGLELSASADLAEAIRYRFNPSGRGDSSARRFGENLLHQLPPQTRLLAYYRVDPSTYFIATFLQKAEGWRSDVSVDNLRGYDGMITLENLFQTYPDRPVLYLSRLNAMYETGANRVEAISDAESSLGARVYRVTWTGTPATASSLSPENSNWTGHMSLLEPALGLRVLYRDELWYVHLRFQNALLYPREGRVDHLRIQPALISFSFNGLNYAGKIFQDRILGEWSMPSDPELHGEWEVRKQLK